MTDAIYAGPSLSKTDERSPSSILYQVFDHLGVRPETAKIEACKRVFFELCEDNPENIKIIMTYAFINAWTNETRMSTGGTRKAATRTKMSQGARDEIIRKTDGMVAAIQAINVLDMITPSGKRVRECTFAELKKLGGFFTRLAAKGKPNQIVGKVLSDK